jgi:hypothetical protein
MRIKQHDRSHIVEFSDKVLHGASGPATHPRVTGKGIVQHGARRVLNLKVRAYYAA